MTITSQEKPDVRARPGGHVRLTIDGVEVDAPKGALIIRACEQLGIIVPRFCDHPLLDPAGACRQCLVEVEMGGRPMPKPEASCTMTVADGMVVQTQHSSPVAEKAQDGVMELLLINHPLDCPICDKGGECPLQNQAMTHRPHRLPVPSTTSGTFPKPLAISTQVLLDRERCVLCQRCTRFSEQIAGDPFIDLLERGAQQQIGVAQDKPFQSYFSGNTIQICPVGALTSAAYRFRARPFDLVSTPSVCEHCASGCASAPTPGAARCCAGWPATTPRSTRSGTATRAASRSATRPSTAGSPADGARHGRRARRGVLDRGAPAVAAEGLLAARDGHGGGIGVLTGGRLTVEDAYAYAKFARVAAQTNDIDFRARPHSARGAGVPGRTRRRQRTPERLDYAALEAAPAVLCVGLEPEEESPIVFLRLRKAVRKHGQQVFHLGQWTTPAVRADDGAASRRADRLVTADPAVPGGRGCESARAGRRAVVVEALRRGDPGRRAGGRGGGPVLGGGARWPRGPAPGWPGCRGAPVSAARSTPARRRTCCPAAGWCPTPPRAPRSSARGGCRPGRCRPQPGRHRRHPRRRSARRARRAGRRRRRPERPADPQAALAGLRARSASWSAWSCARSAVTELADVVLPVAPDAPRRRAATSTGRAAAGRSATPWTRAACCPTAGCWTRWPSRWTSTCAPRRPAAAAGELARLGPAAPPRTAGPPVAPAAVASPGSGQAVLATWRQLIDAVSLAATSRTSPAPPGRRVCGSTRHGRSASVSPTASPATVRTERGAITLPVALADLPDGVVWLPTNSPGLAGAGDARGRARRSGGGDRRDPPRSRPAMSTGAVGSPRPPPQAAAGRRPVWLILLKVVGALRPRRRADPVHDLARAQGRGPDAAAPRPEPGRPDRAAAEPRRRPQAGLQGRHHAGDGRQDGLLPRAGDLRDPGLRRLLGDPVRPDGVDLRPPDGAAADRPAGRRARRAGLQLDRRLRHRARPAGPPARRTRCSARCARPRR